MRLLIVEDEAQIHRYYAKRLSGINIDFDIAESRIEAIDLLRRRSYQVALIDLSLTDDQTYAQGKEVLSYVQRQGEGTKCVIVSASPNVADVIDTWEGGAVQFIQKSSASYGDIVENIANDAKDVRLNLFGRFDSLNAYLAHPELTPHWESLMHGIINCGFEKMQAALTNTFKKILPVLRPAYALHSFNGDATRRCLSGVFWSKNFGCAVLVCIGREKNALDKPEDGDAKNIYDGQIGKSVFSEIWTLPNRHRDEFPEFIHETPWRT